MNRRAVEFLARGAVLLLTLFCGQILAAEFTADMAETQQGEVKKSKLYVKGERYSMEVAMGDEQILVLVDPAAKKTIVVIASDKEYRELAIDDMMAIMNDPFQGYVYTAGMGEEKSAAAETIAGRECDKYVVSMTDTDVMSKWVAKDLGFPIKIVAHGPPDRVMELNNIVVGPVDDAKFKIPDGFTKWIDPETLPVEPPEWAGGIEAAPVMTPPFEHAMAAGDIIRIKPAEGKSLALKAVSSTDTEANAKVIPFKDGRPLKKESWYNNAAQKGTICARMHETAVEADEFVVYVYEGTINANAKWQPMQEHTVGEGRVFGMALPTWDNIETRMINMGDGEAVVVVSYNQEGAPLSDDDLPPLKWRTTRLSEPGEMKKTTLVHKGDEIVFSVEKGTVLIKAGQFDSFEF